MTDCQLDLSDILRVKPRRAACMWDIGRAELEALPYVNRARPGDLVAVVRTFTTDPRPGYVMNDSHEPAFCLRLEDGTLDFADYSALDPAMRRIAGPIDTAVRTDPSLQSWVRARLEKRCPFISQYPETFEALCFRDAVVLHDLDYLGTPDDLTPRELVSHIIQRIDVVFPEKASNHALIPAIAAVECYLTELVFREMQGVGLHLGDIEVKLEPF